MNVQNPESPALDDKDKKQEKQSGVGLDERTTGTSPGGRISHLNLKVDPIDKG